MFILIFDVIQVDPKCHVQIEGSLVILREKVHINIYIYKTYGGVFF